jgi:DegV family protein with EDD domain
MLKIVSDSSMDMPAGWEKKYEINILPINIQFGTQTFRQGIDLSTEKFYQMVKEYKVIPHTSLPSPSQIAEFYKSIARKGEAILSLHVASKMSGTFNAVQLAAEELAGEFEIYPFDSGNGSAGLAFMCREARVLSRKGGTIQTIINRLEEIREQITIVFAIDSLEFARMNGRISALQERIISILQIKPIIVLKDGLLEIAERVRTRKKSMERIVDLARKRVGEQKVNIAVVHAQDFETARILFDKAKEKFNVKDIIMTDLSISVAANLGPGTVGIVAYPIDGKDYLGK